jgi:hypothetical protein
MRSPEDKQFWLAAGEAKETIFVESVLPALGLRGTLNPAKASNTYAPDLIVDDKLAELKCQRTPFFKAQELYGVDPQYAVTLNTEDFERYCAEWPSLDIYFWIHWQETTRVIGGNTYSVEEMAGVWRESFPGLQCLIKNESVGSHEYLNRLFDRVGNAKSSFVFDLRHFEFLGGSITARDSMNWDGARVPE